MLEKPGTETMRRPAPGEAAGRPAGAEEKNLVAQIDQIINEAASARASEVHFEPGPENLVVRVRQAGVLKVVAQLPETSKTTVANRLKIMGQMDITKFRVPQSGYFKRAAGERKVEFYVYTVPTLYGEALVVRISDKQSATMHLAELSMDPKVLATYRRCLAKGSGLYLVSGPPGSGKRTTIYASILEVLKPDRLAMAFDPVIKYEIAGMVQGKPEDKSEFTFAEAIEALMRQEPDVAYIGDIACEADARATIQGAFAKRIVLARMSANDSLNTIQNLIDMGIQPFLLAASVTSVINQRLVRRLCEACREPYAPDESLRREVGYQLPENVAFFRAKGCPSCNGTGYHGAIALFELYHPSEELNKMIVAKEPMQAIRARALKEGMYPLKWDGVRKAAGGMATLEDVLNSL